MILIKDIWKSFGQKEVLRGLSLQVPIGENPKLPKYRGNIGIVQGWVSIIANLLLFIIKLVFGFMSNSGKLLLEISTRIRCPDANKFAVVQRSILNS